MPTKPVTVLSLGAMILIMTALAQTTLAVAQAELKAEGLGATAIAERLGIGRASVYRLSEGSTKRGSRSTIFRRYAPSSNTSRAKSPVNQAGISHVDRFRISGCCLSGTIFRPRTEVLSSLSRFSIGGMTMVLPDNLPILRCLCCGSIMKLVRTVPRVGGLPALFVIACSACNEVEVKEERRAA